MRAILLASLCILLTMPALSRELTDDEKVTIAQAVRENLNGLRGNLNEAKSDEFRWVSLKTDQPSMYCAYVRPMTPWGELLEERLFQVGLLWKLDHLSAVVVYAVAKERGQSPELVQSRCELSESLRVSLGKPAEDAAAHVATTYLTSLAQGDLVTAYNLLSGSDRESMPYEWFGTCTDDHVCEWWADLHRLSSGVTGLTSIQLGSVVSAENNATATFSIEFPKEEPPKAVLEAYMLSGDTAILDRVPKQLASETIYLIHDATDWRVYRGFRSRQAWSSLQRRIDKDPIDAVRAELTNARQTCTSGTPFDLECKDWFVSLERRVDQRVAVKLIELMDVKIEHPGKNEEKAFLRIKGKIKNGSKFKITSPSLRILFRDEAKQTISEFTETVYAPGSSYSIEQVIVPPGETRLFTGLISMEPAFPFKDIDASVNTVQFVDE